MISRPAAKEPMELPILAMITISSTLRKRFLKKYFSEKISLGMLLMSWTVGFLIVASTRPVIHPQAISGFKVVNGAATREVRMLKGCPKDRAVKTAAGTPVQSAHDDSWRTPVSTFMIRL